ncbi:MAG TPA: type II toxin-antitoxin system antitoxin SocA domain-containing protein [Cyclobacteriaceae bacterium]
MITSKNVAEYFLLLSDPDIGDSISNLKLQKLVYYAQGFHLAMYDSPLFDEPIMAWEHGPVVESLYHEYKNFGANGITPPDEIVVTMFSDDQMNLLDEVFEVYGQYSAWKLRNMTHSESPWIRTKKNEEIDQALMKRFFKTQLRNN